MQYIVIAAILVGMGIGFQLGQQTRESQFKEAVQQSATKSTYLSVGKHFYRVTQLP